MSAQIIHRYVPVILSVLLAVATSSRGLSADDASQNREGATTAAKTASLDRILAAWQTRQDRTESLHFVFQTGVRRPRGNGANAAALPATIVAQQELWITADGRFRFDVSAIEQRAGGNPLLKPRSRHACDATTNWSLEWFEDTAAPSLATLWGLDGMRGIERTPEALQLAFRPFSRLTRGRQPEEWRLVNENAILDNVHFVKVQRSIGEGRTTDDYWVDPARDNVIAAWEQSVWGRARRRLQSSTHVSIRYRQDSAKRWVPESWTRRRLGSFDEECTVIKLTLNEKFPAATFTPDIPPGTVVLDKRVNRVGVAAANVSGAATALPAPLAKAQRALDTRVDFEIEPEPLKDALDFIGSHCQAPFKTDEAAFERASIDNSMEVKAKMKGRTLLELLMSLLKECPGQAGITVKDGTITVTAVPRVD